MLLPGCKASKLYLSKPVNGPLFIHLRSFDIFIRIRLRFLTLEDNCAAAS
jgi:hypothetical protein